jgi:hypothetical protein
MTRSGVEGGSGTYGEPTSGRPDLVWRAARPRPVPPVQATFERGIESVATL